jgi:uncharacterized protein (TIGR00369 family)
MPITCDVGLFGVWHSARWYMCAGIQQRGCCELSASGHITLATVCPSARLRKPLLPDPTVIGSVMTDAQQTRQDVLARQFIEAIPHAQALGMKITEVGAGRAVITMPYDTKLIGDPETGVIHGGAVSALMDTCGGAAVMSHPDGPMGTATLDLRIDYMRSAKPGDMITAIAECYHMTRSVAFVRATAMDADTDRPVATATGAFSVQLGARP